MVPKLLLRLLVLVVSPALVAGLLLLLESRDASKLEGAGPPGLSVGA